jgi:photosynthetic reaction center PufX protein
MADRSDIPYFHEPNKVIHLRVWVLGQMIWGAFIAGLVVVGIALVMLVIWGLGLLLPEESKTAPSPYGALEIIRTIETA